MGALNFVGGGARTLSGRCLRSFLLGIDIAGSSSDRINSRARYLEGDGFPESWGKDLGDNCPGG